MESNKRQKYSLADETLRDSAVARNVWETYQRERRSHQVAELHPQVKRNTARRKTTQNDLRVATKRIHSLTVVQCWAKREWSWHKSKTHYWK